MRGNPRRKKVKDDLRRKTDAELEARRQRVLKILDGEPSQPANMERMLRQVENEQTKRSRFTHGLADTAVEKGKQTDSPR